MMFAESKHTLINYGVLVRDCHFLSVRVMPPHFVVNG